MFKDVMWRLSKYLNIVLKPMYKVYERWLWFQIAEGPIPKHVAIIPDGNRRWARKLGKSVMYGHDIGYIRLKEVLKWLWELGIKIITIYAMSYENCVHRSEEERRHLFNLIDQALIDLMNSNILHEKRVRVRVFGRLDMIPAGLAEKVRQVEELTKDYEDMCINVALCYGGRQEIIDAAVKMVNDVVNGRVDINDINEKLFSKYLYTSHLSGSSDEPDLVMRTSGELRLSNFLLWQIAYSELYFCDVFWPEFRKIDLWRAIRSYQMRERRFGK